jgi:hypothetical protein
VVRAASEVRVGSRVVTTLADGVITSEVVE